MTLKKEQCLDLSKTIESDLQKDANETTYSSQLINGTGFKYLKTVSDFTDVRDILLCDLEDFLKSWVPTIKLMSN